MKKYAVLLETVEGVDVGKVSDALAKAKKMPLFEASKRMGGLTGIVEENLDESTAQNLVFQLRDNGIRSFIIEMGKMISLPLPIEVNNGRVTGELLHLERGNIPKDIEKWDIRWDNILLLACARVREDEIIKRIDTDLKVVYSPRGGVGVRPIPVLRKVARGKWVNLLDIFSSEPEGLFRVEAESFNFSSLGLVKLMPTHYQNLVQLIGILVERATEAFLDTSIKFILDGNPLTNLRTPGLKSYETRVKWAFIKRNE